MDKEEIKHTDKTFKFKNEREKLTVYAIELEMIYIS